MNATRLPGAGPMTAAWVWASSHIRRRWLALVAVGLLAAIAGAAILTAIAGARRTASVYDRYADAVLAPHATLGFFDFDPLEPDLGAFDRFYATEGVEAATAVLSFALRPAGSDLGLFDAPALAAADSRFGLAVSRFDMVAGRPYDHGREDEVVMTEEYAQLAGAQVGDVIRFESWPARSVAELFAGEAGIPDPDGPVVELRVVGIARQDVPVNINNVGTNILFLTEAFTRRWAGVLGVDAALGQVRLVDGPAGFPSFSAHVSSVAEPGTYLLYPVSASTAEVAGAIDAQVLALVVFALVAAAAGVAVTHTAIARQLSVTRGDQEVLRSLGVPRPGRMAGIVMIAAIPAATAGVVSSILAFLGSGLLPIGTAGALEPAPGMRVDRLVLGCGGVLVALAVVLLSVAVARSIARMPAGQSEAPRAGALPSLARWFGSVPSVSVGLRMALHRGRGERYLPSRSTTVVCALGVTGAVGALAFAASVDHLTATPRLYGWASDAVAFSGSDHGEAQELVERLRADPEVDHLATWTLITALIDGKSVETLGVTQLQGGPMGVVVSGRELRSRDEVVLGSALADRLEVGIGDSVDIAGADGAVLAHTVVGIVALPRIAASYREQAAVLEADAADLLSVDDTRFYGVALTFGEGVDAHAAVRSRRDAGLFIEEPVLARSVANLDEIVGFPRALAALLGVLALAALTHALTVTVRRRGRELAVLRVLGFSRRQVRAVPASQSTTMAVVSLAAGVPLGIAVGRLAWSTVAGDLGVVTEHRLPPFAVAGIVLIVVVALLAGMAIGRRPSRGPAAAQLRPAGSE